MTSLDKTSSVASTAGGSRARRSARPGYDPYSSEGANLNLLIDRRAVDPVSGTVPHRSFICQVALAEPSQFKDIR